MHNVDELSFALKIGKRKPPSRQHWRISLTRKAASSASAVLGVVQIDGGASDDVRGDQNTNADVKSYVRRAMLLTRSIDGDILTLLTYCGVKCQI